MPKGTTQQLIEHACSHQTIPPKERALLRGEIVAGAGLPLPDVPIKPFADNIGNYTSYDRHDKR